MCGAEGSLNPRLMCWGEGKNGKRGSDNELTAGTGNSNPAENVPMPTLTQVAFNYTLVMPQIISVGGSGQQSCAAFSNGGIRCWGKRNDGTSFFLLPEDSSLPVLNNVGDAPGEMNALRDIIFPNSDPVVALSVGSGHACAMFKKNILIPTNLGIRCWGRNDYKQGGINLMTTRLSTLGYLTFPTLADPIDVSAGSNHTCAVFSDSQVRCWGQKELLGLDVTPGADVIALSAVTVNISAATTRTPVKVRTHNSGACVLFDGNDGPRVRCWGYDYTQPLLGVTGRTSALPASAARDLPIGTAIPLSITPLGGFTTGGFALTLALRYPYVSVQAINLTLVDRNPDTNLGTGGSATVLGSYLSPMTMSLNFPNLNSFTAIKTSAYLTIDRSPVYPSSVYLYPNVGIFDIQPRFGSAQVLNGSQVTITLPTGYDYSYIDAFTAAVQPRCCYNNTVGLVPPFGAFNATTRSFVCLAPTTIGFYYMSVAVNGKQCFSSSILFQVANFTVSYGNLSPYALDFATGGETVTFDIYGAPASLLQTTSASVKYGMGSGGGGGGTGPQQQAQLSGVEAAKLTFTQINSTTIRATYSTAGASSLLPPPPFNQVVTIYVSLDGFGYTSTGLITQFYKNVAPKSLSPTSSPMGGLSTPLEISGNNFVETGYILVQFWWSSIGDTRTISGTSVRITNVVGPPPRRDINTTAPGFAESDLGHAGLVEISVSLNNGLTWSSPPIKFYYFVVTTLLPRSGPVTGDTVLIFGGFGLDSGPVAGGLQRTCRLATTPVTTTPLQVFTQSGVDIGNCFAQASATATTVSIEVTGNGISYTASGLNYTYYATPTISLALTPNSVPAMTEYLMVTITGSGFPYTVLDKPTCKFSGNETQGEYLGPTSLRCLVASFDAGRSVVEVAFNGQNYQDMNPKIELVYFDMTSIFPPYTSYLGGSVISVFGSGYSYVNVYQCLFGGTAVDAIFVSTTTLKCIAPGAPAGTNTAIKIRMKNFPGSTHSDSIMLQYMFPPNVTAIFPTHVLATDKTAVTVYGANLLPLNPKLSGCSASGKFVQSISSGIVPASNGTEFIVCMIPAGVGVAPLEVTRNQQDYSASGVPLTFFEATTIVPTFGPVEGGGALRVQGSGYSAPDANIRCWINDIPSPVTVINSQELSCDLIPPSSATKPRKVVISMNAGLANTTAILYTYVPTPVVSAVFPVSGPSIGGARITVYGSQLAPVFGGAADQQPFQAKFGSRLAPASSIVVITSTTVVSWIIPRGSGKTSISISVNSGSYFSSTAGFFYYFSIFTVSPPFGPSTGGTRLAVSGIGFSTDPLAKYQCRVDGGVVTGEVISENLIICLAPAHGVSIPTTSSGVVRRMSSLATAASSGYMQVQVSGDGGNSYTTDSLGFFGYIEPITVSSFTPTSSPTSGGSAITIYGAGFVNSTLLAVRIDDAVLPATFLTNTMILSTIPAHKLVDVRSTNVNVSVSGNGVDWASSTSQFSYLPCPVGTFSLSYSSPCNPCNPGTYNNVTGKNGCPPCDRGSYQDEYGATSCKICPANTRVEENIYAESIKNCTCLEGFYNPDLVNGSACISCPEGGYCKGNSVAPRPIPGYWASAENPFIMLKCSGVGRPGCESNTTASCQYPYTDRLCASCEKGYYMASGVCQHCPNKALSYFLLALFLFICIIVMLIALRVVSDASVGRAGGALGVMVFEFQVLSLVGSIDVGWDNSILQVMRVIRAPFTLSIDSFGIECIITSFGYKMKWILRMAIPVFFLVLFGLAWTFAWIQSRVFARNRTQMDPEALSQEQPGFFARMKIPFDIRRVNNSMINGMILAFSLSYLFMTQGILNHFDCTRKGDGIFSLDASPQLPCYESWWYQFLGIAVPLLVIYVVAIPIALMVFLHHHRRYIRFPVFNARYGSLFANYSTRLILWESVSMLEKVWLVVVSLFLDTMPAFQVASMLAVFVIFLMLQFSLKPYWYMRDNHLSLVLRWCIVAVLSIGYLVKQGNIKSTEFSTVLLVLFFVLLGLMAISIVVVVALDIYALRKVEKRSVINDVKFMLNHITYPHGKALLVRWIETGECSLEEQEALVQLVRCVYKCLRDSETSSSSSGGHALTIQEGRRSGLSGGIDTQDPHFKTYASVVDVVLHRIFSPLAIVALSRWMLDVGIPEYRNRGGNKEVQAMLFVSVGFSRFYHRHLAKQRSLFSFMASQTLKRKSKNQGESLADKVKSPSLLDIGGADQAQSDEILQFVALLYGYSGAPAKQIMRTINHMDNPQEFSRGSLGRSLRMFQSLTTPAMDSDSFVDRAVRTSITASTIVQGKIPALGDAVVHKMTKAVRRVATRNGMPYDMLHNIHSHDHNHDHDSDKLGLDAAPIEIEAAELYAGAAPPLHAVGGRGDALPKSASQEIIAGARGFLRRASVMFGLGGSSPRGHGDDDDEDYNGLLPSPRHTEQPATGIEMTTIQDPRGHADLSGDEHLSASHSSDDASDRSF